MKVRWIDEHGEDCCLGTFCTAGSAVSARRNRSCRVHKEQCLSVSSPSAYDGLRVLPAISGADVELLGRRPLRPLRGHKGPSVQQHRDSGRPDPARMFLCRAFPTPLQRPLIECCKCTCPFDKRTLWLSVNAGPLPLTTRRPQGAKTVDVDSLIAIFMPFNAPCQSHQIGCSAEACTELARSLRGGARSRQEKPLCMDSARRGGAHESVS